jgi:hypothetical protein
VVGVEELEGPLRDVAAHVVRPLAVRRERVSG